MGQTYKMDRLRLITYKGQKRKTLRALHCRYMAKSHIVNCDAELQKFTFVNFRGLHFTKVNFKKAVFYGCDFWGTTFNSCLFHNTEFRDCVFMGCKFKNCDFSTATFSYSIVVNTNLAGFKNINDLSGIHIYNIYPTCNMSDELSIVLQELKDNRDLRKNKLLFISDTKYNHLNLFLLQKRYGDSLPNLLHSLASCPTSQITTYKKLERTLNGLKSSAII